MSPTVDPRGQRFGAGLTAVVLGAVLVTGNPWLLVVQAAVFAAGVLVGPAGTPYAALFARVLRTRLDPGAGVDARPARFAQGVGLTLAVLGLVAFAVGAPTVALLTVGVTLAAALLNATLGVCLGCVVYLLARRWFPPARLLDRPAQPHPTATEVSA